MPKYDDSGFFRPKDESRGRDLPAELGRAQTERDLNFQWGRLALAAVPGLIAVVGVGYLADTTIGERDRRDYAPVIPFSVFTNALVNGTRVTVGETSLTTPKIIKVMGWATYEGSTITYSTNQSTVVQYENKTYSFVASPPEISGQPSVNEGILLSFTNASLPKIPEKNTNAFTLRFTTKEQVRDYESPFPHFLKDKTGPTAVLLTLGNRLPKQTATNEFVIKPLEVLNPVR